MNEHCKYRRKTLPTSIQMLEISFVQFILYTNFYNSKNCYLLDSTDIKAMCKNMQQSQANKYIKK